MSDAIQLYDLVVTCFYLTVVIAIIPAAAIWLALNRHLLQHFRSRRFSTLIGFIAVAYAMTGLLFAVAVIAGQVIPGEFLVGMLITAAVTTTAAAIGFPLAVEYDETLERPDLFRYNLQLLLLAAIMIAWNAIAFMAMGALFEVEVRAGGVVDIVTREKPILLAGFGFFALAAAVIEEVIFRGVLQGVLQRTFLGPLGAMLLAAFIFTIGHAGYVSPVGVKETQVFGLALIFGYARLRYGLTAAIGLHVTNNFIAIMMEFLGMEIPM